MSNPNSTAVTSPETTRSAPSPVVRAAISLTVSGARGSSPGSDPHAAAAELAQWGRTALQSQHPEGPEWWKNRPHAHA